MHRLSPKVHPHPRGESPAALAVPTDSTGSPPPAWGKPRSIGRSQRLNRFTPTRVGKARAVPAKWSSQPVHPHPRGESLPARLGVGRNVGSPPPAWGKRRRGGLHPDRGSSPPAWGKQHGRADHDAVGSPPPAWGKRHPWSRRIRRIWFTPTRVGKALSRLGGGTSARVHPHPRGESSHIVNRDHAFRGSPPPAWGKRSATGYDPADDRFTPTRVGKARGITRTGWCRRVHPHPRGESRISTVTAA